MEKVTIIGSGPAGYTAAIYCARAELPPLLIAGPNIGGQLTQTTEIENFPGFPNGVDGINLMIDMQKQAERFGTKIIYNSLSESQLRSGGPHTIILDNGDKFETMALIIATGATPKWLGLEGEKRLAGRGVSACATCDGAFFKDVPVVVVGGGDSAVEEATFLTKFASKVYIIHRRDKLRASKIMAKRAMNNPKIEIVWNSVVVDILGRDKVEGVKIKNVKNGNESIVNCNGYFAALGHIPATDKFSVDKDERGYIKLIERSSKTSIDGVFAAGDCVDSIYRQAIVAAGMGCMAAIDVERWLEENINGTVN